MDIRDIVFYGLLVLINILSHITLLYVVFSAGVKFIPGRTLFVIAHPDDEVMFFGPSILRSEAAYILSISRGAPNGTLRSAELNESCRVLGLADRCYIDGALALEDGFEFDWPPDDIRALVWKYVQLLRPNRIVTFDTAGASGHPNHIAIARALMPDVSRLLSFGSVGRLGNLSGREEPGAVDPSDLGDVPVYFLMSAPQVIKYLGFYGAAAYIMAADIRVGFFATTPPDDVVSMRLGRAFEEHKSQGIWYRYLWFIWSRFTFFNHLVQQRGA
jgi:N-acetylglucosaminylphosphatidylinositol deacetylase